MAMLYHVSGWSELSSKSIGESFVLHPGRQNAEGIGVYFAEGAARISAAEGCQGNPSAIVVIEAANNGGWWQSKAAKARKFGKARTWHSDEKSILCRITSIDHSSVAPVLHCVWNWA